MSTKTRPVHRILTAGAAAAGLAASLLLGGPSAAAWAAGLVEVQVYADRPGADWCHR